MDPKVIIRKGTKKDLPNVLMLIQELAEFEKAAHKVNITKEVLAKGAFGDASIFEFTVAEKDDVIVGMALFYPRFSTWNGPTIYLEDLIVTETSRGYGIGRLLMDDLILIAKKRKVAMIHWEVLDWNTPAIDFYKKYDAIFDDEWVNVKIAFNK